MNPSRKISCLIAFLVMLCLPALAHWRIRITLDNEFIDKYKDRVLIDMNFTVGRAHERPNAPSKVGDLHVAGLSGEIRRATVAEIMNAKFENDVVDSIHDV